MAKTLVSQPTSNVKTQNNPIKLAWLNEQTPVVSSVEVAHHFGKKHKHVLREIKKIISNLPESFHRPNFGPMFAEVQIGNGAVRKDPAYNLTRDAFTLLVMGFTGKAALKWKLRYIEAFNALERAVLENSIELAREAGFEAARELLGPETETAAWEQGRKEGMEAVLSLTPYQQGIAREAKRYQDMGLTQKEIARLIGCCKDNVGRTLRKLREVA